jgi:hypothetical protein
VFTARDGHENECRRGDSYTIWGLLHLQAEITLAINLAPLEARQACSITGAPWKLESRT